MTSQKPYLLHDTVFNNVIYPLSLRGIRPEEKEVDALLTRCGLEGKKKQYARSLSSGEQQKLSFARALIFGPRLLIVDETLSNLDPDSAELFEDIILERQKTDPITFIIISHQLVHMRRICNQVHFMEKGRLLTSGSVEETLIHPVNPSVKSFLEDGGIISRLMAAGEEGKENSHEITESGHAYPGGKKAYGLL